MTHCCLREHKTQVFPNEYNKKPIQLFVKLITCNDRADAIKNTLINLSQSVQFGKHLWPKLLFAEYFKIIFTLFFFKTPKSPSQGIN